MITWMVRVLLDDWFVCFRDRRSCIGTTDQELFMQ